MLCRSWFNLFIFFFFKQKTAYEMRISDWSSDVCSSDLLPCSIGTAIAVPCFAVAPTANLAAAGYFLFILSNSFGYVSMSATFQDMVPPALRGRITSFWYLVTYIGAGVGPLVTGLLTDRWLGSPAALPEALVSMSLPIIALSLVCTLISFPLYDGVRAKVRGAA